MRTFTIIFSMSLLIACAATSAFAQTLSSDLSDYPPGSEATLTGSGFMSGESVVLQVRQTDGSAAYEQWRVMADESGSFVTTWTVCDCVGATLKATADGVSSGLHAECFFTDATAWTFTIAPATTLVGESHAFILAASNISTGGGNQMGCFTINIPSGFTPIGNPSVVAGSTTHSWTIGRAGQVITAAANSNADRLNPGESIQFSMVAAAPPTTAGSPFVWTATAKTNTNCTGSSLGVPQGGLPSVSVTCAPAAIVCPANITVGNDPGLCSAIVNFAATASGSPAPTVTYSKNPGTVFPHGSTTVTATATNSCGTASCSFTVTVNDTEKPVVTLAGADPITVEYHGPAFTDPGATAEDACAGSLAVVVSGSVDVNTVGDYVLAYTATDPSGNSDSLTRTVHVVDRTVPVLVSNTGVDAQPDRIRLTWYATSDLRGLVTVYRRTADLDWVARGEITTDGTGYLRYEDTAVLPAVRYGYRLGIRDGGSEVFSGEVWAEVAQASLAFALAGVWPSPSRDGALMVHFTLPSAEPARLELMDIRGRRQVEERVSGPGRFSVDLGRSKRIASGIYFVRLSQGANVRTVRAAVLK